MEKDISMLHRLLHSMNDSSKDLLGLIDKIIASIENQKKLDTKSDVGKVERELEQEKEKNRVLKEEINEFKNDLNVKKQKINELNLELVKYKQTTNILPPLNTGDEPQPSILLPIKITNDHIITSVKKKYWGSIERKVGLEQLKNFVEGAKELIITDSFFYCGGFSKPENEEYLNNIKEIIDPSKINKLHIITNPKNKTDAIRDEVHKIYGKKLTEAFTFDIHDRIWIVDSKKASLLGTSLNSIGNKLAFFLPLPYNDLESMKKELKKAKLLHDQKRKKRMTLHELSLDEFISFASNDTVLSKYLIGN